MSNLSCNPEVVTSFIMQQFEQELQRKLPDLSDEKRVRASEIVRSVTAKAVGWMILHTKVVDLDDRTGLSQRMRQAFSSINPALLKSEILPKLEAIDHRLVLL